MKCKEQIQATTTIDEFSRCHTNPSNQNENLRTSARRTFSYGFIFWDSSEFAVVWFSFVYVLLDSVSYGSWADVEEKSPKYSSKWALKVGNFH